MSGVKDFAMQAETKAVNISVSYQAQLVYIFFSQKMWELIFFIGCDLTTFFLPIKKKKNSSCKSDQDSFPFLAC